jgi:hypothetical protein
VVDGQEQVQMVDWVQVDKSVFPVQVAEVEGCCSGQSGDDLELHVQKPHAVGRMATGYVGEGGKNIDMVVASATWHGMECYVDTPQVVEEDNLHYKVPVLGKEVHTNESEEQKNLDNFRIWDLPLCVVLGTMLVKIQQFEVDDLERVQEEGRNVVEGMAKADNHV